MRRSGPIGMLVCSALSPVAMQSLHTSALTHPYDTYHRTNLKSRVWQYTDVIVTAQRLKER